MTENYVFRINGKSAPFGRSKLIKLAERFPTKNVQVIDTKICKPIGYMRLLQAKQKFS